MKKWVTIFPDCKNFHLIKDVGYIPYIMSKNFKFESSVVTFNNDIYDYVNTYLKGLKIEFLNQKIKNDKLAVLIYLLKYSKKIDVLNLFHLKPKHLIYIYIYKLLNKKGKAYIKLDANETIKNINLNEKQLKSFIYKKLLKYCDLISVETKELYEWLNNNWEQNVEYIPNGFWINNESVNDKNLNIENIKSKQNYITAVGRIGDKNKNIEILIEAFKRIYNEIPNWKLYLVGEMTDEFSNYLESVKEKYPDISKRIIKKGYISDLELLDSIYRQSKIFCMTSISESFGLVFVEAIKNGCYIVSSDVLAAKDIVNEGKNGTIFKSNDLDELTKLLRYSCDNYDTLCDPKKISEFAYDNFSWIKICENIYKYLGFVN